MAYKNGSMTDEEYKRILETQMAKDRAMCKYFMQIGQKPKAQICFERSKVIKEELAPVWLNKKINMQGHQLNNSMSKTQYSFSKSRRF